MRPFAILITAVSVFAFFEPFYKYSVSLAAAEETSNHPMMLLQRSASLWQNGKKDEAVFWFYAGQLRYRSYLGSHPNLDPSGEPALFSALMENLGRPINEYAFGDIPKLAKTIDDVLAWDEAHPDRTLSSGIHQTIRKGLVKLRDTSRQNAASIKIERTRNGLWNK